MSMLWGLENVKAVWNNTVCVTYSTTIYMPLGNPMVIINSLVKSSVSYIC